LIADIIQIKTSRINSLKNMIENYRTRIETAQEKLKKLNQKLSDIKSGTFSSYLSFDSKKHSFFLVLKSKTH
jgi:DNA repair ATPase RecN